jgi:hypothetical protein
MRARREFQRVIKAGGYVAIVYNVRKTKGEVEEAYAAMIDSFGKSRADIPDVDDAYVEKFLNNSRFRKIVFPNSQSLDFQGMLGRLASASYMPLPKTVGWSDMKEEVRRIFEKFGNKDGTLILHYDTTLYLGRILRRQVSV